MTYENVIVEKIDAKKVIVPTKAFPVYLNFKADQFIGRAYVWLDTNGELIADITFTRPLPDTILWPAIGYQILEFGTWKMNQIGICTNPNIDASIKCLDYLNSENAY